MADGYVALPKEAPFIMNYKALLTTAVLALAAVALYQLILVPQLKLPSLVR